MRIVYAAAAVEEVADILLALAAESPNAAERLQARLGEIERQIAAYPASGKPTSARGLPLRSMVLRPYSFILFYRHESDEITVVGVRHGARDPGSMPGGGEADLR